MRVFYGFYFGGLFTPDVAYFPKQTGLFLFFPLVYLAFEAVEPFEV